MQISSIKLTNFRNYRELNLEFDSDINVLYGENAQGKTNILEAIYLCSCLRSHRTSKDSDLISHEADGYEVFMEYYDSENKGFTPFFLENIKVKYQEAVPGDPNRTKSKRIISHNGMVLPKISDLMGLFHAVIFAPEDLMLIKEGPANRRRFVDILISQIRVSYFNELCNYNKILAQRNSLLKQMKDGKIERDYEQLVVWDISLAQSASRIIATRMDFTEKIGKIASKYHKEISSGKEEIYVKYKTISGISSKDSVETINNKILEKLKTIYNEDVDRGNTIYGPHRDDLEISLDGTGIKPFASQGQQRTAVLSLKIAELEIIKNETGSTPVLLLDDVMSELDYNRRKLLLSSIGNAQILLTCTDRSHIADNFISGTTNRTIQYFHVENGNVSSVGKNE